MEMAATTNSRPCIVVQFLQDTRCRIIYDIWIYGSDILELKAGTVYDFVYSGDGAVKPAVALAVGSFSDSSAIAYCADNTADAVKKTEEFLSTQTKGSAEELKRIMEPIMPKARGASSTSKLLQAVIFPSTESRPSENSEPKNVLKRRRSQ